MHFFVKNTFAMETLGTRLATVVQGGEIIYLKGDLGAGKTTLVRGFLYGLGYTGKVKSPTYTLVEYYSLNNKEIYHFDLYRLHHQEELEAIGIRDYCCPDSVCLFEWPEKGAGVLPSADMLIHISHAGTGRDVELSGRAASLSETMLDLH